MARYLQIPGLLSSLMSALSGDLSTQSYLLREGWTQGGWGSILAKWLDEQLQAADPSLTLPTSLRENDRFTTTIYRGVGLCFRRQTVRGAVLNVLTAPSEEAANWVSSLMAQKGGGVIRLLPPKNRKRTNSDNPFASEDDDDDGRENSNWSLEHHSWPSSGQEWVEGSWAPTRAEVAGALFPEDTTGRSILLIGPPGVGKTETAIRACLLRHGQDSRILVVHGSVFARGSSGMTGRDAVALVRAFKATALIVDDMPPTATVAILEEFEALHREKIAVAITLMTDGSRPRLPGLRPGRVDEVIEFGPPSKEGRLALLRGLGGDHPAFEEIAYDARSEGMPPAYLRELASRVRKGVPPERALTSLAAQRDIAT